MYPQEVNKYPDNQYVTQVPDNQRINLQTDCLVVGQGIAGTVLTYNLIKHGKSVMVIDKKHDSSASRVAAGLYNPIVFKLFTKSWKIDEALPFADDFYADLESFLETKFYHKKRVHKVFGANEEKEQWEKKKDLPDMQPYINPELQRYFNDEQVNQPFGSAAVNGAGNLEVGKMLDGFREYLKSQKVLIEEDFSYNELQLLQGEVNYKDISAKHIVFCEGYKIEQNPFFSWLPFKLTKGEILTIHAPLLKADEIMNRGVFVLPLGDNLYRVGATYNWDDLTEETTEAGKEELVGKLDKLLKIPYRIIDHVAGIRPTVNDRRPILGKHPIHQTLAVFNGLGTKGVQLSPYFAEELVNHILHNTSLDKEANINRFYKKFTE